MPIAILAFGTLLTILVVGGVIALIVMVVYAFRKMRSDDFWDEQG